MARAIPKAVKSQGEPVVRVYLDNCCLNRAFDDQSQDRIRLETEAIALVMLRIQQGNWLWVGGDVLYWEVLRTPDEERRNVLLALLDSVGIQVEITPAVGDRAKALANLGFRPRDALHLASAENASAGVLFTTDDRLIKKAKSLRDLLRVRAANPADWIREAHQ